MAECLFCKIVRKEVQSQILFENDEVVAFRDINPQAPTHILIVSRKHITGLSTAADDDSQVLGSIQKAARDLAYKEGLHEGFRVVTNNGRGAGQSVDHLHYHLLGGRRFAWPPG